ncbi:HD-GYP domain-containing protein [Desulfurivibrio dismutans]|uniref:HD-GYP domain-containing protein n=1 Tax=Desulfurivibrio dismutans TaxID=1398908 RepID=UPI0023DCD6EA|nr:HD domain-containing phosphohydrolase [Desulfurivibrio alkaliphilus]MDF1614940.1 HD domain-containing protein [Desulfurivibrio alkaliphilus]
MMNTTDNTDKPTTVDTTPRALVYFILSPLLLSIYGGKVCPLIETLPWSRLFLTLLAAFAVAWVLYLWAGRRWLAAAPLEQQARLLGWLVGGLFLGASLAVAIFHWFKHDFPMVESGLKLVLGCATLGFFAALDLALERDRQVARQLEAGGQELLPEHGYFSLTRRFLLLTVIGVVFLTLILLLLVIKDMQWLAADPARQLDAAIRSVTIEFFFVLAVLLGLTINLATSYSRNLQQLFQRQTEVLKEVSLGHLEQHVPVTSRNEFGVIAKHTNNMIEGLRQRTEELQQTRDVTIVALASLAETRDNETGQHILRTQRYIRALSEHLAEHEPYRPLLSADTIDLLFKSAPLHDIGKVGIPDRILLKPGKLTDEEFAIMKEHPEIGSQSLALAEERLGENSFLRLAREIALTHHEKWDGSGYPQGLRAEEIPLSGRLMALADVYDALISKRVYKPAFNHAQAKEIILAGRGGHFDPRVVDAFLSEEKTFIRIAREYADQQNIAPASEGKAA